LYSSILEDARPNVDDIMRLDLLTYLPDDILAKVDRSSMAHSLEVRSPFLDPAVVDFALRLPYAFKQKGTLRKRIMYDAFNDLLPDQVFRRPKMGFGVPVGSWLRGEWKVRCRELLLDGGLSDCGLFQRAGLEALLDEHNSGRMDHSYVLFSLLVLETWRQSVE
jgi:asparagine synthase (glutamine-hydrolysing)